MGLDVALPAALIAACRPPWPDIAARLLPVLLPDGPHASARAVGLYRAMQIESPSVLDSLADPQARTTAPGMQAPPQVR
jgi:hypothetical protein